MNVLFNTENRCVYIRRVCFGLLLIAAATLQNTPSLLPEIFGARPMLLIPATVCIAMFEREIPGTLYGAFAGLMWDACSPSGGSFNAILLAAVGFACGSLITHLMRNNLMTALLLCSVFTVLHSVVYWMRIYIFGGNFGGALSLLSFYLPSCIYTLIWLPVFYFLTRWAMKKFSKE